jgi:hypothetical protein
MNETMRSSLGQADPSDFAKGEKLNEKVSQLLAQGFTDLDGAIVFTAMRNIAQKVKPESFPDLTGFECFVNHIHVEDQLDGPVSDQAALIRQGIAFALAIDGQLRSTFSGKPFKVIVAATAHGCGVRFYLVRPGEEWLASDLNGYGEAILVLEDHSVPTTH